MCQHERIVVLPPFHPILRCNSLGSVYFCHFARHGAFGKRLSYKAFNLGSAGSTPLGCMKVHKGEYDGMKAPPQ
jgi:hypothetical protein